jgi:hypothetical protein
VLGSYLRLYNDLVRETTLHFVGLRKEEHELFLATATKQGRWLAELVDSGKLPVDTHIAISCVGAIPYYSDLRTLDRLGLTDRTVAHRPTREGKKRVMGHDKQASPRYAVSQGVDLWAADIVHLILPLGHPRLFHYACLSESGHESLFIAEAGDGLFLLVVPVQGPRVLRERFPELRFLPAAAYLAFESAAQDGGFVPVPREEQLDGPYDIIYVQLGLRMIEVYEDLDAAKAHLERAVATNPENSEARRLLTEVAALVARSAGSEEGTR